MLEAVVALPDQLFYNTGISTYFWIVTNRKSPDRRGKVPLVDARDCFLKRKSMGEKRKEITDAQIGEICRLYTEFTEGERVKIFPNHAFGFQRITVERPLRLRWEVSDETLAALTVEPKLDEMVRERVMGALAELRDTRWSTKASAEATIDPLLWPLQLRPPQAKAVWNCVAVRDPEAEPVTNRRGEPEPDPELRDYENVPLPEGSLTFEEDVTSRLASLPYRMAVDEYFVAEVQPWMPDAWVDHEKTKVGYEIPVTRHFYRYTPPRPLEKIDAEIRELEAEVQRLLAVVTNG
jgi:type I restriction enzyme M protein